MTGADIVLAAFVVFLLLVAWEFLRRH